MCYKLSKVQTKFCMVHMPCATHPRAPQENAFGFLKVKYTLPGADVLSFLVIIKCKREDFECTFPPPSPKHPRNTVLRPEEARHHLVWPKFPLRFCIHPDAYSSLILASPI